jgi:hypothetical protein
VVNEPASERASAADAGPEAEDAEWVSSFLLTWPGKTYRVAPSDEARADAAHEVLEAAARNLIDRILRESQDAERDDAPRSHPPS